MDSTMIADKGPWIELANGERFYLYYPTFPAAAIGHSLAIVNRYNGHSRYPVSVAQHSVFVSLLAQELRLAPPFEALMHDVPEFVLADVVSPFKAIMPQYKRIESDLDAAMRVEHGLPAQRHPGVHTADMLARFIEADIVLPNRGRQWDDPDGLRPRAMKLRAEGWRISEMEWRVAKSIFLQRYEELKPAAVTLPAETI
jgi:hypothetical protein